MVALDRRAHGCPAALSALLVLVTAAGCASSSKAPPEPLPPRAVAAPPPTPAAPAETPPAVPEEKPATVVVIDPGVDESAPPATLAEAAAQERERRRTADRPIAVINNKNLGAYAAGVTLTEAAPGAGPEGEETGAEPLLADGHDEAWWRSRGLEIRKRWRDAVDAVPPLEGEVADLRRRFYSADDPYLRDSQIKPAWDRALAELEAARRKAADSPRELEAFLEEGRKAGALPGWLREGAEFEPVPVAPEPAGADPAEPRVLGESPPNP